jgi:iron complex outermembrane receptor protein
MAGNRAGAGVAVIVVIAFTCAARAQGAGSPAASATRNDPEKLRTITVTAKRVEPVHSAAISPEIGKFRPPLTIESIDRRQIEDTTNTVDTEDAVKYLPSLFLRKRDYGDTQATLQTRTWGVNSSARSLVYVDDVPISALISNNNTTGAPRWGMVSPSQIKGIDMLYGPFAAAYPGNSMGGVLLITTRMPTQFSATLEQNEALQSFDLYRTRRSYQTSSTTATVGDRTGPLSWFLSFNREDSDGQPLYFITSGSVPAGTTGAIPARNKAGAIADVAGAGGIQHAIMDTVTGRLSLDLTGWLRAAYSLGYFDNRTAATDQTYLTTAAGSSTFGGISGFAGDDYRVRERHLMNALSLKTDTGGVWDWEAIATRYDYLQDIQRNPAGVLAGDTFEPGGYLARLDGTGWSTEDLKGIWRPGGIDGDHEVSAGLHHDRYILNNPTYDTDQWTDSPDNGNGALHSEGRGRTDTYALWVQDAWQLAPVFTLTTGGRLESWRASDGFNLAGSVAAAQPAERSTNFSPKLALAWRIDPALRARLSLGEAYRYPTVGELYQIVSTGATYSIPDANLTPEHDYSGELALDWQGRSTRLRLSLFQESTVNALISQTSPLNGTYTTTFQNVARIRNRGVEFVAERRDMLIRGLDLSNSLTYVDSTILSDPSFRNAAATTATGRHVPYVPDWRDTVQATYHSSKRLAFAVSARYQGRMYSTLDNTDSVPHVFGAFDTFFVVDTHVHYRINALISVDAGIDNLFNDKYFEYHPFPTRTYVANLKVQL